MKLPVLSNKRSIPEAANEFGDAEPLFPEELLGFGFCLYRVNDNDIVVYDDDGVITVDWATDYDYRRAKVCMGLR